VLLPPTQFLPFCILLPLEISCLLPPPPPFVPPLPQSTHPSLSQPSQSLNLDVDLCPFFRAPASSPECLDAVNTKPLQALFMTPGKQASAFDLSDFFCVTIVVLNSDLPLSLSPNEKRACLVSSFSLKIFLASPEACDYSSLVRRVRMYPSPEFSPHSDADPLSNQFFV